jgi:cellulose synthase/poly-beta-1,6-N-acetylglucosamine synthase-like glycosyltransferase
MDWQLLFYRSFSYLTHGIIVYVATINLIYFLMMALGFFAVRHYNARLTAEEREAILKSPLAPEIAVIAPAYNEALTVRESVRGMLKLHYPNHQVIVVNDGSKDDTLKILIEEFRLYKSARAPAGELPHKPIRAVYESRDPLRLIVIDKENGGKADSLNAGLDVARAPLVAAVDSDSLLDPDSLLHVVKPFLEDPENVIACGGIIRVVNGCEVRHSRVKTVSTASSILALFQTIEYLRAFLGGRVALSFLNSLLIISGAFGVFRRDVVLATGGFAVKTVGEDMELVVRLHEQWRTRKTPYKILYAAEPLCWTEVPESAKILHRQRNRWQRGTVESISLHKRMLFNPRFGVLGMFAIPYFTLFEMFGPAVEALGYIVTFIGLAMGIIAPEVAILFFVVSVLFGILLSMSAIVLEEYTTRRYPLVTDVLWLFTAAVAENLGFRQLLTWWRTQGLIDGLKGKTGWGAMERRGFQAKAPPVPPGERVVSPGSSA